MPRICLLYFPFGHQFTRKPKISFWFVLHSIKMFARKSSLDVIFYYFQFCGICHFAPSLRTMSKSKQNICIGFACLHLIVLSSILSATIYFANDIFLTVDSVTYSTDVLHFFLPVLSQFVAIIESIKKREIRHRIWKRMILIDKILLQTSSEHIVRRTNRFLLKGFLLQFTATLIELLIVFNVEGFRYRHIVITIYTYFMNRSQVLFCILFVDMLKCRLDMLILRLERMRFNLESTNVLKMRRYKKAYGMIWLSLEDLNQSSGSFVL